MIYFKAVSHLHPFSTHKLFIPKKAKHLGMTQLQGLHYFCEC